AKFAAISATLTNGNLRAGMPSDSGSIGSSSVGQPDPRLSPRADPEAWGRWRIRSDYANSFVYGGDAVIVWAGRQALVGSARWDSTGSPGYRGAPARTQSARAHMTWRSSVVIARRPHAIESRRERSRAH